MFKTIVNGILHRIRNYFITGMVVIVPIILTIFVVVWVWQSLDNLLPSFIPVDILPRYSGLGIILLLALILFSGWVFTSILGRVVLEFSENLLKKLPILRSIYSLLKQVSETLLSHKSNAFSQAVLLEYPRAGAWTIGFVTANPRGELLEKLPPGNEYVIVYVPTTPNPTSGFMLIVARDQIKPLDMPVEQAIKMVISLGIV